MDEKLIQDTIMAAETSSAIETDMGHNMFSVSEMTPFLKSMSAFIENQNLQLDRDKIIENGMQSDVALAGIREAMANTGVDTLQVGDMLDLEVLADPDRFNEYSLSAVAQAPQIHTMLKGLKELGFATPTCYKDFNLLTYDTSKLPKELARKLFENWILCVKEGTSEDTLIDEVIEDATADLLKETFTIERFCKDNGIEYTPEKENSLLVSYRESYNEYIQEKTFDILERLLVRLDKTVMIDPQGMDELKESLRQVLDSSHDEFIDSLTADDVLSSKINEYVMQLNPALTKEQLTIIAQGLNEWIDTNSTPVENLGGQQGTPQAVNMKSINMAEIIIHAIVLASADLVDTDYKRKADEELAVSPNTIYIIDNLAQMLTDTIDYIEFDSQITACKILSIFSHTIPLMVSRISTVRMVSREYQFAQTAVSTVITEYIAEQTAQKILEGDE